MERMGRRGESKGKVEMGLAMQELFVSTVQWFPHDAWLGSLFSSHVKQVAHVSLVAWLDASMYIHTYSQQNRSPYPYS